MKRADLFIPPSHPARRNAHCPWPLRMGPCLPRSTEVGLLFCLRLRPGPCSPKPHVGTEDTEAAPAFLTQDPLMVNPDSTASQPRSCDPAADQPCPCCLLGSRPGPGAVMHPFPPSLNPNLLLLPPPGWRVGGNRRHGQGPPDLRVVVCLTKAYWKHHTSLYDERKRLHFGFLCELQEVRRVEGQGGPSRGVDAVGGGEHFRAEQTSC